MKKTSKFLAIIIVTILLFCTKIYYAAEYVSVDGYTYALIDTGKASLVGWDNSSDTLIIPEKIGNVFFFEIGDRAFINNDFIKKLDISKAYRLSKIGSYAFSNSALEGFLSIPFRVTEVGTAAFEGSKNISELQFGSGGHRVPAQCFKNCSSLAEVILTDNTETVEQYAFQGCSSLNSIIIPKTVYSISKSAFKGDSNLTIKCYMDSYAEQYAKDNGIDYEILDPLKGDADGNRVVNISDATAIQKYKAGLSELTSYGLKAADVNGDGSVTVRDATLIQMRIAGIIDEF